MAVAQPWLKFYPTDWRGDQALRVCSLAARGLWMECLCIMHEANPYGHLIINGRPVTDSQLSALTGAPPSTVRQLLTELEEAGVFSTNRNGVIYSRRMTRDEKKRKDGKKAQETEAKVPGSRRSQAIEKKKKNLPPPRLVDGVESKPPQHPEAREEIPVAKATEAPMAPSLAPNDDLKSRLFGAGLNWLSGASERPTAKLRPMVGRWIKDHGEGAVLEAFTKAYRESPVDPVAWIERTLKGKIDGKRNSKEPERNGMCAVFEEFTGGFGNDAADGDDDPGFSLSGERQDQAGVWH